MNSINLSTLNQNKKTGGEIPPGHHKVKEDMPTPEEIAKLMAQKHSAKEKSKIISKEEWLKIRKEQKEAYLKEIGRDDVYGSEWNHL